MIRRPPVRCVAPLVTAIALTGCATFTDDNIVARVGDAEFTQSEFEERATAVLKAQLVAETGDETTPARVDGDLARGVVGQFITVELIRADLVDNGVALPDLPAGFDDLEPLDQAEVELNTVGNAWVQALPGFDDAQVRTNYNKSPRDSKVACAQHVLVDTESEAQDVLTRLDIGDAFADVAATSSIDTQSGAAGGALGCLPLADFRAQFVPEFVEAAETLLPGTPTLPVKTDFGYHIIRVVPFDELTDQEQLLARLVSLSTWIDVSTDPRFGTWSFPQPVPLG